MLEYIKKVITMMAKQAGKRLRRTIRNTAVGAFAAVTVLVSGPMGCVRPQTSFTDRLLDACNGKTKRVQTMRYDDGINVTYKGKPVNARVLYYLGETPGFKQPEQRRMVRLGDSIILCPKGADGKASNPHYKPPHEDVATRYVDPTGGRKSGETEVEMTKTE